jgi:hypothetical protein
MDARFKVAKFVLEQLAFFKRIGSTWHCQSWTIAFDLGVSEVTVREVLISLAHLGFVSIKAWNYAAWREVNYWEMPGDRFFFNRDDRGYVRVRPVI